MQPGSQSNADTHVTYAMCEVYFSVDLSLVHNNDAGATNVVSVMAKVFFY